MTKVVYRTSVESKQQVCPHCGQVIEVSVAFVGPGQIEIAFDKSIGLKDLISRVLQSSEHVLDKKSQIDKEPEEYLADARHKDLQ